MAQVSVSQIKGFINSSGEAIFVGVDVHSISFFRLGQDLLF